MKPVTSFFYFGILMLFLQAECSRDVHPRETPAANENQPPAVINYDTMQYMPDPGMIQVDTAFFLRQIDSLSHLIEVNPKDGNLFARRGDLKSFLGDYAGACEDYRRAKKLGSRAFKTNIEKYCP